MSGKGLKSLKDENQDLQKQIGCITGFFQLFNRHRLLTNQNTTSYIHHTSPSSGGTNNDIKEQNSTMRTTKAKNVKVAREKPQFSTESSITSVSSSSCSSSMSSVELNRLIQTESPSTSRIRTQQNPHSKAAMKQHDTPVQRQKSLDFYDIVKDSMHREAHGLSVSTVAKKGHTYASKRIDSPRPLQPYKSVNAGVMVSNEPIHILCKSKRTPWDSPRLSYDGRYTQDTLKSATKQKELPRLSLDSKQRSIRGVDEGNKARNLLNGPQKGCGMNSSTMLNQLQEPDTSRRSSSSSVVARLMGLEALPVLTQPCCEQLEASKGRDSVIKVSKSSLSVYGEIEKRLAELEFKKSGKDLRALKQILEAMQRYQDSSSDNRNNNTSPSESSRVQSPRIQKKDPASVIVDTSNSTQGGKLPIVIMKPARVTKKANNPKNGRLVLDKQKANGIISTRNIKDPFGQPKNNMRTSRLMQSSKVSQDGNGKNTTNSGSSRLQKKFGIERRSPPTSPSSDSSINRRQHNRQQVELSSSSTTSRQNFSILQDRNDRFSDCHWQNFKHHVNVISSDLESIRSLDNRSDIEVIGIDQSGNINSNSIQLSGLNQNNTFEELRNGSTKAEKIVTAEQPSPVSVLDAAFYREDPPSPVKKKSNISKNLGEALSTDDDSEENSVDLPPSSCITNASASNGSSDGDMNTEDLAQILNEINWIDEKLVNFNNSKNPDHKYVTEILLASGLLRGQSSSHTLHSHGHWINPKLFFAIEQMKTNKSHFNIEDSAKNFSRMISSPGQMQRKLIFDVVNDILVKKLIMERSSSTSWFLPNELKGKHLLEEICTEIDQLQPQNWNVSEDDENFTGLLSGDLKHHHTIWTNCGSETPNVVLDIERLIFKDLITEVVTDELANHFGSHCRTLLFPK